MKNSLTKNLGLKILSLFAAFFLWLIVVNVDDPVISRTYTGIPVELVNENVIADEGKCYEILGGTDTINVVVTAKRSVVDQMSRDYIKATADFGSMTFLDRVPIEVKSLKYSDQIDSISSRTEFLKIELEDIVSKKVPVKVEYEGIVASGHVLADVSTDINEITVKGPESLISTVMFAEADVNVSDIDKDAVITATLNAVDEANDIIDDHRLSFSHNAIGISVMVDSIKEIPISCGYSGNPVAGYVVSGSVMTDPSSVRITGRGENFEDMDVIYISPDAISVEGAMADMEETVDISDYLPSGVSFADEDFIPIVRVDISIAATVNKTISVPLSNITIENLPEGYIASIVDIGGNVEVGIQGLGDTFDRFSGDLAIGRIDAMSLVPRNIIPEQEGAPIKTGENDGVVEFDLPMGISIVNPVSLMVIVDYVGDTASTNVTSTEGEEVATDVDVETTP